eukprot:TRINITY_DN3606_c1_g1_i1.p1 TRINITY_DN3606_c1_g1~~TRINITY_DN3606_c1_g1_i1.p1  ORF type:complete len:509 (+),score=133.48 TRINITY_DN3606_c1_g1_i1:52-1578(+)
MTATRRLARLGLAACVLLQGASGARSYGGREEPPAGDLSGSTLLQLSKARTFAAESAQLQLVSKQSVAIAEALIAGQVLHARHSEPPGNSTADTAQAKLAAAGPAADGMRPSQEERHSGREEPAATTMGTGYRFGLGMLTPQQTKSAGLGVAAVAILGCLVALSRWLLPAGGKVAAASRALELAGIYILVSASMIESNKWLMQEEHFPYPLCLTAIHMFMSTILANCLRLARPDFFPAVENIKVTPMYLLKFLQIGVPFAVSLVCGNWAYKYLSVSFLQIMKQSNVVTIYFMCVVAGLEELRRCNVLLLIIVIFGAGMAVQGEMHFLLVGFLLQAASSLSEATKVILQSMLMSGSEKLDSLSMVLVMAPACFLANLVPLIVLEGGNIGAILPRLQALWPILLVNGCCAFSLNVIVAQCIKQLSAVGYLLAGICKDIVIIVSSAWLLGEALTRQQQVGFSIALGGVGLYSLYKQNKSCFEDDNLLAGFRKLLAPKPELDYAEAAAAERS